MKTLLVVLALSSTMLLAKGGEWAAVAKKANADAIEYNKFWTETEKEVGKLIERKDDPTIYPTKAAYERALKQLELMPAIPESFSSLHNQVEKEIKNNPAFDISVLDSTQPLNVITYYRYTSALLFTQATGEYPSLKKQTAELLLKLVNRTTIDSPSLLMLLLNDSLLGLAKEYKIISLNAEGTKKLEMFHKSTVALKEKARKANELLPDDYAKFSKAQRITHNQHLTKEFTECRRLSKELLAIASIATF